LVNESGTENRKRKGGGKEGNDGHLGGNWREATQVHTMFDGGWRCVEGKGAVKKFWTQKAETTRDKKKKRVPNCN